MSKYNLNVLPDSIIDTFKQSNEPLTSFQKNLLGRLLEEAQLDILKLGLENILIPTKNENQTI